MNLASRCREAIGQVAMLKKELAQHQRRAAEALALQRQQHASSRRTTGPVDTDTSIVSESPRTHASALSALTTDTNEVPTPRTQSLTDVAAEMDRMDRILAAHAAKHNNKPAAAAETETPQEQIVAILPKETERPSLIKTHLVSSDDFEDEDDVFDDSPVASNDRLKKAREELLTAAQETKEEEGWEGKPSPSQEAFFPQTASPKMGRASYNEEYPGDLTAVRKKPLRIMERLGDFNETDDDGAGRPMETEESPPAKSRLGPFDSLRRREDKSTLSSIDAFEASFSVSFPDSFSPRDDDEKEEKEKQSTETADIYNPFSTSPNKGLYSEAEDPTDGWKSTSSSPYAPSLYASSSSASTRSSDPPGKDRTSPRRSPTQSASKSYSTPSASPPNPRASLPSPRPPSDVASRILQMSSEQSSAMGESKGSPATPNAVTTPVDGKSSPEAFRTPPSTSSSFSPTSSSSSEPQRPEKTGYVAARARYERALQTRSKNKPVPESLPEESNDIDRRSPEENGRKTYTAYSIVANDKTSLWGDSPFDEEGDIPLRSNLDKNHPSPPMPAVVNPAVETPTSLGSRSNRSRPWERASSTLKSNGSWKPHDDAEDPCNSPLSRFRSQQAKRRVVGSIPFDPTVRVADGE